MASRSSKQMAQNYRESEGRKVDTSGQERSNKKLSGSNSTMEGFQDRKDSLQGQLVRKPTEERIIDYSMTESKAYSGIENPTVGTVGTIGVEELPSDTGPKIHVKDSSAEWGQDAGKAEDAGIYTAPEQDVQGVRARATDNLQQQSRYVHDNSKLDCDEKAYGGEAYKPMQVQEEPLVELKSEPVHDGTKEKIKEKVLDPLHKSQGLEVDQQQLQDDQAAKSPGFVEKIKEMFGGKPQNEDANTAVDGEACKPQQITTSIPDAKDCHGDEQPTSEPPKKGVIEKIKEKLSPSP